MRHTIIKGLICLVLVMCVFTIQHAHAQIQTNISYERYLELIEEPKQYAVNQLPDVKRRFKSGDLDTADFFVVIILTDESDNWEQVFIQVERWNDGMVSGILASEMGIIEGAQAGDPFVFEEKHIVDWLIIYEDGKEEGNFIPQYLVTLQNTDQ